MLRYFLYIWTLCLSKQLPRNLFEIQGPLVDWSERFGFILVLQNYPITRGDVNIKTILSRSKTILSGANGDVIMSKDIEEHYSDDLRQGIKSKTSRKIISSGETRSWATPATDPGDKKGKESRTRSFRYEREMPGWGDAQIVCRRDSGLISYQRLPPLA